MSVTSTEKDPRGALVERLKRAGEGSDAAALVEAVRALAAVSDKPADMNLCAQRLKKLDEAAAKSAGIVPLRCFIARSVTVEPMLPFIQVFGAVAGLHLDMQVGGYGSYIDELMNPAGALAQFNPDVIFFFGELEDISGELPSIAAEGNPEKIEAEVARGVERALGMLRAARAFSKARLVFQGYLPPACPALGDVADANLPNGEVWAVREINRRIAAGLRELGDAALFDQDALASRHGTLAWRDERMFHSNRLAVAAPFFAAYARGLVRTLRALVLPPRKVLVTDLDNTLWGGIVGEDGPDGIATGAAFPGNCYQAYQRSLKHLAQRGILLAIVSKNNEADALEAFERRRADLLLGIEDFVAVKISWDEKAEVVRELARELSLGLDSFVFVDDSPMECAAMRERLPQVLTIQAPHTEPWRIVTALSAAGAFDTLTITDDDRRRVKEYKVQAERAELETKAGSREEFLASLGIVCTILDAREAPLARTAQLLAKTNQFNLTTRRHSASEIEAMAAEPNAIALAIRARDRFGDAGVVGVALARPHGDDCILDTLLLSCRVIGRGIETILLHEVARRAAAAGAKRLVGEYIPTAKNPPCADFYPKHRFIPVEVPHSESQCFAWDLQQGLPERPAWITLEDGETR